MAVLTVRRLPEDVHQALASMARVNGRSMEAEAREIISQSVLPQNRLGLGEFFRKIGQRVQATPEELAAILTAKPDEMVHPIDLLS